DLNAAIRSAVPALRNTDALLALLDRQNRVLRQLLRDGDIVTKALYDNRRGVTSWVRQSGNAAAASAERRAALAAGVRKLPRFLSELRPAMASLGRYADTTYPVLDDLHASAARLDRFTRDVGDLSSVSRPSIEALGDTAAVGRPAVRDAVPTAQQLRAFAGPTPEVARNLRIFL